MTIQLKFRGPDGTERPWRLKEIVQGKPIGHPSHPMFVHFPVAFYIAALVGDVVSKIGYHPWLPLAATWAIGAAFAGSALAVPTGLVDWAGMARGSRKRTTATRHMLLQFATFGVFLVDFIARFSGRGRPEADVLWIVLDAVGVSILLFGQYLGGVLVYEMGMRVSTVRYREKVELETENTP